MAKRTQGQGYQTPNEKYNAEFGQETAASKVKQSEQNKVQENFQTPDEKYNAEFGVENTGQTGQVGRAGKFQK
ncbi:MULTISPECIES: hypothetical protein [Paenibacillus]|uniref:Small, acid-soluble spore protein gamma-type n=1 Tax=Paenibacillus illinoisensis TaxID=59845 RepID=A0A2W0C6W1_9BACL|nr:MULTISPECIES: hypothetical protein [Paenibacillus]MBM6384695.1 hypothetical protein [Paenibacillus sp.]PAD31654.1 hypothetical protein CHH60_10020 [Paenibacillus sp. 7523-1]PAF31957.1 hypothetical protein CHI14_09925 [Paenibacillus sp. 7516]PYY28513.1 Uncharacterized protein PIL02S_03674 [Paenibacillus illinoisensis]